MGNHNYRVFKINQKLLQPCNRIQIQVVGRLVEKQDIRIAEQSLGEEYFYLCGARHISHHNGMVFGRNAKTV